MNQKREVETRTAQLEVCSEEAHVARRRGRSRSRGNIVGVSFWSLNGSARFSLWAPLESFGGTNAEGKERVRDSHLTMLVILTNQNPGKTASRAVVDK